jgi:hypothetical protein
MPEILNEITTTRNDEHTINYKVYDNNIAILTIYDVNLWKWIGVSREEIVGVDPEHGPYISIGYEFYDWKINRIYNILNEKNILIITIGIESII